jgi:putative glycosyltransferase (TIGR04348 family)
MARIFIATPARPGTRNGNLHTAQRWAGMLRSAGHRVGVGTAWQGERCDILIALHALRSHDSVLAWRATHPSGGLVVTLSGTDLYRDLPRSAEARRSLELADRIIVLQDHAPRLLGPGLRRKTSVVYQSSDTQLRQAPPRDRFRIVVVGHLREEKDPFRAVAALARVDDERLELLQVGGALSAAMAKEARRWMRREPRYRWLGSLPHGATLRWIARSHAMVISSRMEGGANVISEAARIGTPVLASRMSGNLGMLGRSYRGYFRTGEEQALADLIEEITRRQAKLEGLRKSLARRRKLFSPAAEKRALLSVISRTAR